MANQLKVGIIGAGAMGLLYAANFAAISELTLFTRRKEQSTLLNQEGLSLKDNSELKNIHIKAAEITDTVQLSEQQLLIVAVKQYSLKTILPVLQQLSETVPLLFIQNGAAHLDSLSLLGDKRTILLGISEHGAGREDDTTVVWRGHGRTKYSVYQGELNTNLAKLLQANPDFPIEKHDSYVEIIQEKLFVNAVINPLTAVLQVPNGKLLENEEWHTLLKTIVKEIQTVLPVENALEKVEAICQVTATNFSSMALDRMNNRMTEIDGIVLPLLEKGESLPTLRTLYHLIKGLEGEHNV
ncbi:2-dehydropantoate 2-reductase [Listeria swaminathanii]|uniref:2-dehydropantoate 2-reductase n=1 Tax=Listeria swaminathanii TaxID=2713501 RepID=A0ABU2IFD1_9LIST|nr:2-dehydropantoate 2-reductase [Listeria swaminathanii]MDT0017575.1 2-dehydropantoate 2-reductase [Listeria swaminathanii]MDT0022664.1 2-dehydropantoate 2-reductase [Listeria swaminathanii]MDT0033628.1 2-dehydropantoate 2-reductase [Listeria swaminathanii]MDT0052420.1 2-dehydropantoate 2-reductase [Listeria swaminathanii]MDT0055185.1 2-dehydropantoate 2-reductase [Listeria swaminathanii]